MVLAEIDVDNIYVVCGYTDMRKSINGLTAIIVQQYQMRPNVRGKMNLPSHGKDFFHCTVSRFFTVKNLLPYHAKKCLTFAGLMTAACFSSAEEEQTGSKRSFGKGMVFYFYTSPT